MTTFSDPPRSRRAVRQSEAEQQRQATPPPFAPAAGASESSAEAAEQATHIAPEPLSYVTQRRPGAVGDEPQSLRARRAMSFDGSAASGVSAPSAASIPSAPAAPQFRVRDYSPQARQSPSWAPQYRGADEGSSLDYRTQAREQVPPPPAAAPEPASSAAQQAGDPVDPPASAVPHPADAPAAPPTSSFPAVGAEQTMTRRQLRALREAQEAAAAAANGTAPVVDAPNPAEAGGASAAEAPALETPAAQPAAPAAPISSWSSPVAPPSAAPWAAAPAPAPQGSAVEAEASEAAQPEVVEAEVVEAEVVEPEPAVADVAQPVDLVEPPAEPKRDAASVFDALFTPPSQRPESGSAEPLAYLAPPAPAPSDRVDLPAPGAPAASATPAPSAAAPSAAATSAAAPSAAAPSAAAASAPAPSAGAPSPFPAFPPPPASAPLTGPSAPAASAWSSAAPSAADPTAASAPAPEPFAAEPIAPVAPAAALVEDGPTQTELPTGHWSTQTGDDDEQHGTARNVLGGHGVVTTNALVLPNIPQPDFSTALTHTGEIMVTGSIDLPQSLSSTGAHPTQLDESALDHELDPGDHQVMSVDSAPVRAIRAVSTHTSTRGVIANAKPKGNRGLTVLIVAAVGMTVAVATLLVLGLTMGVFG
jgi:hypothetical protein